MSAHYVTFIMAVAALANTLLAPAAIGQPSSDARPPWVLAIHGGAGTIPRDITAQQTAAIEQSLSEALGRGREILAAGGTSLDAVEAVVVLLEDDPQFNAGRGAVFTRDGAHELDASIMDGATLATGAVAGVTRVKNPIRAARLVMEKSPHVLLIGTGADAFALEHGCQKASQDYFYTPRRFDDLQKAREKQGLPRLVRPAYPLPADESTDPQPAWDAPGTVGCVALDTHGHLAAATSTGGVSGKLPGRVGDTPICGAGTYADRACAVSCTGKGEQFIRHAIARQVTSLVADDDLTLDEAVRTCLEKTLEPGDGGVIAVDRQGNVSLRATTNAMARGVVDSNGLHETAIWLDR